DIGAASSHWGAINVHWRDKGGKLEYAIFDGGAHHWCYSKTTEWEVGRWYHLGLVYGPDGMRLEIDGKVEDTNPYSGGLARTAKKIGFHDGYNESAPVIIDNFRTYRTSTYGLDVSEPVISPNGDGLFDDCTINYEVADDADMSLDILGKDGKLVKRLIAHQQTPAGEHTLVWDGKGFADGEYTISLIARSAAESRKLDSDVRIDRRWKWRKPKPAFANFFPLGTWYFWEDDASYIGRHADDPAKVNDYYRRTMKDLGDHGFNLVFPCWTLHDHRQVMLDEANRNGIKAILHLDEINSVIGKGEAGDKENLFEIASSAIKDYKDHPAVAGYYMIDEPSNAPDVAQRIARARKVLEAVDPKHPGFSCLVGGYEDLLKAVDYQVLLIDIYPLSPNWSGDWSGYIGQLERGQRNAGERPLWVILQAFGKPNNSWKIPTPEEIRAQVWLALAHGAKGIVYFIYQSTTGFQGEWLQGMVDMDLKPMDSRLEEVGRINADITKLAPTLLRLKPADFKLPEVPASVVAKGFTDGKSRYLILANKDTKNSVTVAVQGIDVLTGLMPPSSLPPGGGLVLRIASD
ncbi:MAG TPA: beta-galactosidase, partial [Armatimonadota bacterium]|nr:beta-galactosidase [Armatimonadota bacterium]